MGKFHGLYGKRWQDARKVFLREHPFCAICGKPLAGADAIVDHIKPHKGDLDLFWDQSNWQALCKQCHDSKKQRMERTCGGCDASGMPTDPRHPWNAMEFK